MVKSPRLQTIARDPKSKAKVAELVEDAKKSQDRIQALSCAAETNGEGLDKATVDSALDELIETFKEANKKLDDLLAKAKE